MKHDERELKADLRGSPTRAKILSVARELFYQGGIRAVGVDTIVAESGVSKTSLYRWFPSKDDLIATFLEQEDAEFWRFWDRVEAKYSDRPREALEAHLKWISDYIAGPKFRGCPFLNATAEFPDESHKAHAVCEANKSRLKTRLRALAERAGIKQSDQLADQLVLLIDGAFSNSQVLGKSGPAHRLTEAGRILIEAFAKGSTRVKSRR